MSVKRGSSFKTMLFGKARIIKMIKTASVIALFLILAIHPSAYAQGKSTGDVNVLLGQRNMDEDDWKPVHEQRLLGVEADFKGKSWPVNILIGFSGSKKDENIIVSNSLGSANIKLEGTTSELYIGARKYFLPGTSMTPYLNAGVSFIKAKITGSIGGLGVSGDDSSAGLFFGGGATYRFGSLNVGFDLRLLTGADIKIGATSGTADYSQFALVLGYGWGFYESRETRVQKRGLFGRKLISIWKN